MNILATVNPFTKYLYAGVALAVVASLSFTHFTAYRAGKAESRMQCDADKLVSERAAQAQVARNIELQRAAEKRYTVTAQARETFITGKTKEIRNAAAPLATCPVPVDAVRLLNAAGACARGDSAAACGTGDQVPGAR